MLKIYPDKILKLKSVKVPSIIIPILNITLYPYMLYLMKKYNGCGLAAIQLGIPLRMFILDGIIIYNPEFISISKQKRTIEEGCLSVKGKYKINRACSIIVNYTNKYGRKIKNEIYGGLNSIIFQHEYDHLQGITIADKRLDKF